MSNDSTNIRIPRPSGPLSATRIVSRDIVPIPVSAWIRHRFIQHHKQLRALSAEASRAAYLITALGEDGDFVQVDRVVGEGKCADILVGRHPSCQLALGSDPSVSLRHLIVRIYHRPHKKAVVKVLDLHSETGFQDESGTTVTALKCEGAFFIKVGQYAIFAFDNDAPLRTEDPAEAWQNLPAREIIDMRAEEEAERPPPPKPDVNPRLRLVHTGERPITFVTRVVGPLHLGRVSRHDERALGFLFITGKGLDMSIPLSAAALARGVLIGRYLRCDIGYDAIPFSANISRIHLVLLLDETGFWAIDAASSNGCYHQGTPFHSMLIEEGTDISLANEYMLRWRTA